MSNMRNKSLTMSKIEEQELNKNNKDEIKYKCIAITVKSDNRYYTLDKVFSFLDDAKAEIDEYYRNKYKTSAIEYRWVTIIVYPDDEKYYTLGKHYDSLEDAKSKIDRYLDWDEPSDSVWD